MDKKIANNIIVGVVFTIGFIAFLFVLFNVGNGTGIFSSQYSLFAKFSNVKGLHYGSEVALAGLHVGVVKSVNVGADNPKELTVEMAIDKKMADQIREDSTATIRTQGVLGDKYIEIAIGSLDKPAAKPGAMLQAEEQEDLFTKGGTLVEEVKRHFEKNSDLDTLLKNLSVLSANLASITTDMRQQKGLFHEAIYGTSGAKLNAAMGHLNEIFRKIDAGEGSLGALINDPTVYEDVKSMMGGAKRSNILKYFMRSFIESGDKAEDQNATPVPKRK